MNLRGKRILVTGGAGFIGSNIVTALLKEGAFVRVLDNLSTGFIKNIEMHFNDPLFEFIEGDICNYNTCLNATIGMDNVSHQAALGSVPRSIAYPEMTHEVNATGFLNVLRASKASGVKRFVYASSSSVYGDSIVSPKKIGTEGDLLSPYAVTKHLNEEYAKVYYRIHGLETVGLRYFNVFGPNQNPEGVYAAAIPKFIQAMLTGGVITIHGDGEQTRDFTYVDNAVRANVLALATSNSNAFGSVFNVACGDFLSLNKVIASLKEHLIGKGLYNSNTTIVHGPDRQGDIRDSLADIKETESLLGYVQLVTFYDGVNKMLTHFAKK